MLAFTYILMLGELGPREIRALIMLLACGGICTSTTLKKICRNFDMRYIYKLHYLGYIKVCRHKHTGKYSFICLTEKGEKLARALASLAQQTLK